MAIDTVDLRVFISFHSRLRHRVERRFLPDRKGATLAGLGNRTDVDQQAVRRNVQRHHHGSYNAFAMYAPDVTLRRGARYVESGKFASAGGLSSGIDLAPRVVERYFGRAAALNTADAMEYQGQGWRNAGSNRAYAKRARSDGLPRWPVCDMAVDKSAAPAARHEGKTFYFCMEAHKATFLAAPKAYTGA